MTSRPILRALQRFMLFMGSSPVVIALAIALALFWLSGCAGPLAMTQGPDKTLACVAVEWATPARIAEACGQNPLYSLDHLGCYQPNTIITRRPTGWSDEAALLVLGHEFFHALGANHERP